MEAAEFLALVPERRRARVWLVVGEEEFLREEAIRAIRRDLLGPLAGDASSWLAFQGPRGAREACDFGPAQVADELRTRPLFAPVKLVALRRADAFLNQHGDALAAAAERADPRVSLVVEARSIDGRRRWVKALSALRVDCKPLYSSPPPWRPDAPRWDNDLARWVAARFAAAGRRVAPPVAQALLDQAGTELAVLAREVESLTALSRGQAVTEALVRRLVAPRAETNAFAVADRVGVRDRAGALAALETAFRRGLSVQGRRVTGADEVLLYLLGGVSARLRHIREGLRAERETADPREVAERAGVAGPFSVRFAAERAAWRALDSAGALRRVVAADLASKGGVPPRVVATRLVHELCSNPSPGRKP
ncbi:MAG: hypothetical protein HY722_17055 [Planctomycetes bacterium]|nr:hypothetical protein [Planctomycetota bacterium]